MKRQMRKLYIQQLIKQGYGTSSGQVCNYLVDRQLDDLLRAGVLKQYEYSVDDKK